MSSFLSLILFGFGLGVVAVIVLEAVGFLWIIKRLRNKIVKEEAELSKQPQLSISSKQLDHQQSLHFAFHKQGVVWVLESGQISKLEKPTREPKRNTELLEVSPIRMYGQIKGKTLILREPDGSHKTIELKGCTVQAVSASILSSKNGHEGKKSTDKLRASQDAVLATGFFKTASTSKYLKNSLVDDTSQSSSKSSHSGSQNLQSTISNGDADEKFGIDEGTLCWNLLISRLFFDAKGNMQLKRFMQARIQRTLSSMRTHSYIGEVICTDINTGNVPPCIVGMRVLPMEMDEVWALEVDIEYSGGAVLGIETKLDVRELELNTGTEDSNSEPSYVGAVLPDLIDGFEYFGKKLNLAERENDLQEQKEDGDGNNDVSKSFKSTMSSSNHGSRWKSIINSVAKQVSQVPFSLAIRVASLKGTLRLHIKPPPSDQLWYGFTSMPDVEFNLESSVGEHKITSGYFGVLLVNRLKRAILENLVLPNSESICIPWMLAEKDDWIPPSVAPFIWINQDFRNETSTSIDTNNQSSAGAKTRQEASVNTSSNDPPEHMKQKPKSSESSQDPTCKSLDSLALPSISSGSPTLERSRSLEGLTTPLLENEKPQETRDLKEFRTSSLENDAQLGTSENKMETNSDLQSQHGSMVMEKQNKIFEQEDGLPRKMGRKERMLDLRKKMSEKLEEKRRHIEEKSRIIVEKMRGP